MLRRYAFVRQDDRSDCGAAALATIALHHGIRLALQQMRDLAGTDRVGTNLLGLAQAAEKLGLSARAVRGPYEALPTVPLPAIAHVRTEEGLGHFVVLYRADGGCPPRSGASARSILQSSLEKAIVDRVASARGWLRTRSSGLITTVLIRCFIDNTLLHSCWRCHRRRDRSFSVRGRQFHVCARCTGLIGGGAFAWALLPWRGSLLPVCAISLSLMVVDGCTQRWKWRESNNALRLVTGIAVGLTLPPTLIGLLESQ